MKIKKHFSHKSPRQIWRILISDSDKMILETRDTTSKEVFFDCYELDDGATIFSDLQPEEKFWLGIEAVYKDIIYFHKFPKPDLPWHKEIIALDIASQKILWTNRDLSFLFADDNLVFGFQQGFEERYFYSLDYLNGEMIQDYGDDFRTVNSLRSRSEDRKDWNNYIYPKILSNSESDQMIHAAVKERIQNLAIEGEVEYNFRGDLLLFNYHSIVFEKSYINKFIAVDMKTGKTLLDEILNANAASLFTDSFFIYKNFLFLLREKNEIMIFEIE